MTLPFADKPESSRVYQDLKTKVLQNLTADEFDSLKSSMFSEGVNGLEDEYRRLLLLGLASDKISTSGPIPGTQFVDRFTHPGSGGNTWNLFEPPQGEVCQLCAASIASFGTGTSYIKLELRDVVNNQNVQLDTRNGGFTEFDLNEPIFVSYPVRLQYNTDYASGTQQIDFSLIRIR